MSSNSEMRAKSSRSDRLLAMPVDSRARMLRFRALRRLYRSLAKGRKVLVRYSIDGREIYSITGKRPWEMRGPRGENPYQQEHDDFFDAIRRDLDTDCP